MNRSTGRVNTSDMIGPIVIFLKYIEKIVEDEAIVKGHSYSITESYMKNLKQQLNIVS